MAPKTSSLILAALLLSGCSALESKPELAWQSIHAIDAIQTYRIANDPCFHEANPLTQSFIGENPSRRSVIGWAVGSAVGHALVTDYLMDHHPNAAKWWQTLTISISGLSVGNNYQIGLRIGGSNKHKGDCGKEPVTITDQGDLVEL
jgi:hypothetical protein